MPVGCHVLSSVQFPVSASPSLMKPHVSSANHGGFCSFYQEHLQAKHSKELVNYRSLGILSLR